MASARLERSTRGEYFQLLKKVDEAKEADKKLHSLGKAEQKAAEDDTEPLEAESAESSAAVEKKYPVAHGADIVAFPGTYTRTLHLSPYPDEADWEYQDNRERSQTGDPTLWAERTDLMELYRKYRKNDLTEK